MTTLLALPGAAKPRLRGVSSLASWLYCFLAYTALQCPDKESKDRLMYACLIIGEAQRHGEQGWLAYDRIFLQQAALDPSLQWHLAIQASTLFSIPPNASQGPSVHAGTFCVPCWGHTIKKIECANHACKCYRGALEKLVQDNPSYKGGGRFMKEMRQKLGSAARCTIWTRSKETDAKKAVELLNRDLLNGPLHCFGIHSLCSTDFCSVAQEKQQPPSSSSSYDQPASSSSSEDQPASSSIINESGHENFADEVEDDIEGT